MAKKLKVIKKKPSSDISEGLEGHTLKVKRSDEPNPETDNGELSDKTEGAPGQEWEELNEEGLRLYKLGSYEGAIAKFLKSRKADPNHPGVYYNLSAVFYKLGKPKAVEHWAKQGLEIAEKGSEVEADLKHMLELYEKMEAKYSLAYP
jgi:tetratricopeptide (TPR) repeat protein